MAVDFEAVWHTHKRFILQVGAGAILFVVLLGWKQSIASAATALAKQNASHQADLQDDLGALTGAEGLEKGRAEALEKRLEPAVLGALLWKGDDGFALPKGEKAPALFYAGAAGTAAKDVAAKAATWNAAVPATSQALGLPTEPEEARVPEALMQADLARRVVLRLLDAGVRAVTKVDLPEVDYQPRDGGRGFLRVTPIRVELRATTQSLCRALAEFQAEGSFLEVTACQVARRPDRAGGDPLEVTLEAQALSIVEQAPIAVTQASGPRAPRRGPRRFGRER
jgi:hypothetical protein